MPFFMDLLKGRSEGFVQLLLAPEEHRTPHEQAAADVLVGLLPQIRLQSTSLVGL
jgi:hypothetical protein